MAERNGMLNLVSRLRRMTADVGTVTWDGEQLQEILDLHRVEIQRVPLEAEAWQVASGTVVYTRYRIPGGLVNFEEAGSGTLAWRLYESSGTEVGTANYTADYINGILDFTADQAGSARWLDARAYDLHAAAADAWREKAAFKAGHFQFKADGAQFNRQQWFEHCVSMAALHDSRARPAIVTVRE